MYSFVPFLFINEVVFVKRNLCYYLLALKWLVADLYEVCRTHNERGVILLYLKWVWNILVRVWVTVYRVKYGIELLLSELAKYMMLMCGVRCAYGQ